LVWIALASTRITDQPSSPRRALAAGAAAALLVGACAALAWPDASPVVPRDGGRHEGDTAFAWAFLLCAAAAFAAYAVGLRLLARAPARLRPVLALAAAAQLVPLAAPLLLSSDAWTYWGYGRIAAVHGESPYAQTLSQFPGDPALAHAGAAWLETTSVYGPAFTLASEPLALAAGGSAVAAASLYKALAALAVLAATVLVARLAARPALAAAFVGWNPVLALHAGGGGHNDAWMAALVVAALALGAAARPRPAGAAWAAAILVKWTAVLFLPLRALEARATGRRVDHLGFAVTAAGIAALATWRYGLDWLGAAAPLARNALLETRFALPSRLEQLGVPGPAPVLALALLFAAAYAWLLVEARRGRARLGLCAGLLLLATPYLTPWYLAWVVPLAALEEDRAARLLALALTAYLLPQTIPV
jgi:hypothetical protein